MSKRTGINLIFGIFATALFLYPIYSLWAWIVLIVIWLAADTILIKDSLTKKKLVQRVCVNLLFLAIMILMYFYLAAAWWVWLVLVIVWFAVDYISLRPTPEAD